MSLVGTLMSHVTILCMGIDWIRYLLPAFTHFYIQSEDEVVPQESETSTAEAKMNVTFEDTEVGDVVSTSAPVDPTFFTTQDDVSDIARFLERPVQIYTYNWSESGFSEDGFDPWTLFFSDTRVKKKLDNFMYVNCKLHLKFVVNCSPFLYGALYVHYRPLLLTPSNVQAVTGRSIAYSQRPGFWLLPQDNQAYELDLPFFWLRDWLQLTKANEISKMGAVQLKQYAALTSANGATTSGVQITVFAYATDLHLSAPTCALSLQSGDEYGDGPISAVATAVAKAAGLLKRLPVIGPFAKATEIGSSAVSSIARIFGYSNVPEIGNAMPIKNMPFPHMASCHGSEPVQKLTLDPKAELTIDSRTAGLDGTDEMAISNICTRQSFLTSFTWATSDAADALKFNMPITPSLSMSESITGGSVVSFTPMSHVAELFNNWRGDLEVTFKIVCSKFHRGRLRLTWDPIGPIATTSGTQTTNVAYTKIVDVGTETEAVVRIPYMQSKKFLETYRAGSGGVNLFQTSGFSNFTDATNVPTRYNGQLTVRVLNTLSAPIDTSSVYVLVLVRGCENLEFANPVSLNDNFTYFAIQSRDELVPTTTQDEKVNLICYGESFSSLRGVLRRYNLLESYPLDIGSNTDIESITTFYFKKFPVTPGYNLTSYLYPTEAKGIITVGSNYKYTFCHFTPLAWMAGAYLGRRGSIRYAFHSDAAAATKGFRIARTTGTIPAGGSYNRIGIASGWSTAKYLSNMINAESGSAFEGTVQFDTDTQSGITVELPQYINNRFELSDMTNFLGSSQDSTDRETFSLEMTTQPNVTGATQGHLRRYVSMGTDFTFLFYLNAPTMTLASLGPATVTPV